MLTVRWMRPAAKDLKRIHAHIAADSAVSANKMLQRILSQADELGRYPSIGRRGRVPGTRELIVHEHYYLVYRIESPTVKILRVKHTSQQWP